MKIPAIPAAAVALLATVSLAGAASAADHMTGKIKSIDAVKDAITLDSGKVFALPGSINVSSFKVGEKVKITYTQSNDKMMVTAVVPSA